MIHKHYNRTYTSAMTNDSKHIIVFDYQTEALINCVYRKSESPNKTSSRVNSCKVCLYKLVS